MHRAVGTAALCALAPVLPHGSAAQEVEPDTTAGVAWMEPHSGEVVSILRGYYTILIHQDMTMGCRADRGEVCMNGDHEDQRWHSSTPREPEQVDGFVSKMTEAALAGSDDPLGFAQAVYAAARLRSAKDALALAGECTYVEWWCELLLGMVHQRSGRPERAERHFRAALRDADPALACQLTGIGELLGSADRGAYRRLSCAGGADFERRFWWLADPMISMPGNDRWAEHVNRRFELILHERLLWATGSEHPASHEESVVRRGHEDSWSKPPAPMPGPSGLRRWASQAAARYRFTPLSSMGDGIADLRYDLAAGRDDEGYTPAAYGPVFQSPAQFARFKEGESLFLAAAADMDDLPLPFSNTVFVLSEGPDRVPVHLGQVDRNKSPVFGVPLDPATGIVGIETAARNGATARARSGLLPFAMEGLTLSDALLVRLAGDDLPASRDEAVASMLGTTAIDSGGELAVYWEIYGLALHQGVEISVQLQKDGEGLLTRVLRTLRLRTADPAPEVSWIESATGPVHPMAITVDVSEMEAGDYGLRIEVTGPDGATATTIRRIQLLEM